MQVHANAPLGPKGRLVMVSRVVEEGWSVTEAAVSRTGFHGDVVSWFFSLQ